MFTFTSSVILNDDQVGGTTRSNTIKARTLSILPDELREMTIDYWDSKYWLLDNITGPAFDVDILTLIPSVSSDKIKGIYITCVREPLTVQQASIPSRFMVQLNSTVDLGKMSNLTLMNCDELTLSALNISQVEALEEEKISLFVLFALKA